MVECVRFEIGCPAKSRTGSSNLPFSAFYFTRKFRALYKIRSDTKQFSDAIEFYMFAPANAGDCIRISPSPPNNPTFSEIYVVVNV